MNADSYFEIGSTHLVCQDYALSGKYKDMCYAIVSDGCSSAPHSEIGSQILCHGAQYFLALYYDFFKTENTELLKRLLGNSILKRADEIRGLYPASYDSLQATLLIAVMFQNNCHVFAWGDGFIVRKCSDGFISTVQIDYPETNAPFYLATNLENYKNKFGEQKVRISDTMENSKTGKRTTNETLLNVNMPYATNFDVKMGDSVTICSDGLGQYQDQNKKPVSPDIVVPMITDYPNYNGVFVQRTMNFMKREMSRKGWAHTDDVAVATVC